MNGELPCAPTAPPSPGARRARGAREDASTIISRRRLAVSNIPSATCRPGAVSSRASCSSPRASPVEMPRAERVRPPERGANGARNLRRGPRGHGRFLPAPKQGPRHERMRAKQARPHHRRSAAAEQLHRTPGTAAASPSLEPSQDYAVCMLCFTLASFLYYHRFAPQTREQDHHRTAPGPLASPSARCSCGQPAGGVGRKFDDEDRDGMSRLPRWTRS